MKDEKDPQKPKSSVEIGADIEKVTIDLSRARMIQVIGKNKRGTTVNRHLIITNKGGMSIL